jgi:hypothetical protein
VQAKPINIIIIVDSVRFTPPPNADKARTPTGAAVNPNVIKTQTKNPITSNMIYPPVHYTDIQAVDGAYL